MQCPPLDFSLFLPPKKETGKRSAQEESEINRLRGRLMNESHELTAINDYERGKEEGTEDRTIAWRAKVKAIRRKRCKGANRREWFLRRHDFGRFQHRSNVK